MTGHERSPSDRWLEQFEQSHGRPLRVLHIGNVANNAYLNAKILNARGIDCDVVCYDYYHIMACPEWEDADFAGDLGDQFYPDWEAVDLKGFSRPLWFAQGPMRCCIAYLNARRRNKRLATRFWWHYLRARRWYRCSPRLSGLRRAVTAIQVGLPGRIARRLKRAVVWACRFAEAIAQRIGRFGNHGSPGSWGTSGTAAKCDPERSEVRESNPVLSATHSVRRTPYSVLSAETVPAERGAGATDPRSVIPDALPRSVDSKPRAPDARLRATDFDFRMHELIARFAEVFPERVDCLTVADLVRNGVACRWWQRLFRHYDVVVGYAVDGKWPLLAGVRPYFAYEHGTIRNIPFEDTEQGRVCALTYRLADGVFITNCDNIRSAGRLDLRNYRFIPHPVNEDLNGDLAAADRLRAELRARLDSDFVVFHPPRQHWEPRRHPDWEKGNDILLRGFARLVREVNPRAGAVLVEWGQTIRQSKELLASLGVADRVLWIPPQPNVTMIRYIRACDLVADQFFLGAFGSTMPKALLHGSPAMLYLDEDRHRWCFPEMPPVINARTPEQVFEGLSRLYRDPDYARDLVRRGKAWYERYHSNRVIAEVFLEAFREVLQGRCGPEGAVIPADDAAHQSTSPNREHRTEQAHPLVSTPSLGRRAGVLGGIER